MKYKRITYVIDDRRYVAQELMKENRLDASRIHEITQRLPDFRASYEIGSAGHDAVPLSLTTPDGEPIKQNEIPAFVRDVVLPECRAHFKEQALPNGRRLPVSVVHIYG